ncbi:DUF1129 family protein [Sutcliffiella sp. NPDC057660]|uniref:DUF1129 family protein n=1 Tax=Sutcliffiella sp. NPDC057660 TaxID=3346199 RepID=UPI0036D036D9
MLKTNATKSYIEENNEKRELLNKENLKLYEDLLLYIRTDLRIAEREGEELLLELLDHLLIAQQDGKSASILFGDDPRTYAEELISGLPSEKKRKAIPFILSQVASSLAWFGLILGLVHLILPRFVEVRDVISLGNLMILAVAVIMFSGLGVNVIFKLMRSTLFKEKKEQRRAYWKAGLFGAAGMALIMLVTWIAPDFGPNLDLEWWVYLVSGGVFFLMSKLLQRVSN